MALNFNSVENAAYYMKCSLEKKGYQVEATSAPSSLSSGASSDYRKFVSFSQRILDGSGVLKGYITYRVTLTTSVKRPKFSSYELFDEVYNSVHKVHLKDYPTADDCFKDVYNYILDHYKMV
jgi:hypothetical protein